MLRKSFCVSILLLTSVFISNSLHAWGERGHHLICEVATRFVKNDQLKNLLKSRGHVMGHLCNIPDIHWKSLGESTSRGNPTHYFEPDLYQVTVKEAPTNLSDFLKKVSTTDNTQTVLSKVGTLWWRAEQLSNLAKESSKLVSTSPAPQSSLEEQLSTLPYNQNVYGMMLHMGLLGHFVGDASMPYHNYSDYDGYKTGHGGIHAYYESTCVAEYGTTLSVEVALAAKALPVVSEKLDVPNIMKILASLSVKEVSTVEKLDELLEASQIVELELGATKKIPAVRPEPQKQCGKFRSLIVQQMSRSVIALAAMWDDIYEQSNGADLSKYKSYRYPLAPDFVEPTYLNSVQ